MNNNKTMSEMTVRKNRHFFFFFTDVAIPLLLFVFTIIIFRNSRLDLDIQSFFYQPQTGWYLNDNPLFQFIYHYGNIPALLLSIAGLVLIWLSFRTMRHIKWRKIGLFLVLAMLLGPGLIINVILKDNWGRPRPRNITEFSGKYAYEKVLSIDPSSPGYSFPCGHASMGFFLFIPWFVLRKKHKGLAAISLATGVTYGLFIGFIRIAQGGHFASDVIVSGILTYLTGSALYYIFKLNHATWYYPKQEKIDSKQRTIVAIVISILLMFLVMGVVLATPYSGKKSFLSASEMQDSLRITDLTITLDKADIKLLPADTLSIKTDSQGFGFPGSKLTGKYHESTVSDTLRASFTQKKKGFFTELVNELNTTFNFNKAGIINLKLNKGSATLVLPESLQHLTLNVEIYSGKLDLDIPAGFKPKIKLKGDFELKDNTGFNSGDSIYVNPDFKLNIVVVEGKVILH